MEYDNILNKPLDECRNILGLRFVKTFNASKIKKLGDLTSRTQDDIASNVFGLGPKGLQRTKELLAKHGLSFHK